MPELADPNFHKTVTCICEHTNQGALGIVINRIHPHLSGKSIFEEFNLSPGPGSEQIPIYIGGPVHPNEVFVLHRPPFCWEGCLRVTPTLALSNTRDIIEAVSKCQGPESFIITLGCAGWGESQLEMEIKQNAWLTCNIAEEIIFNVRNENRWNESVRKVGIDPMLLTHTAGHA